jgi:cytochrome P450
VLAPDQRRHPHADRFVAVVGEEVARLATGDELRWSAWEQLFDRLTMRVVFGDRALEEPGLTGDLEDLMAEANRLVGLRRSDRFYELYGRIERQLRQPEKGSLLACTADAPATDTTRVVHQVPHWMFAMRDTLAANTYRALAVVVADRRLSRRVEEEASGCDLDDPTAVDGLAVLGGVLEEAMRLWPTTPLLTRETTRETELAGTRLAAGTQIMIVNTFVHRDREDVPDADLVVPERWEHPDPSRYNHLSSGAQDCPGAPLVRLLGKAVLARVLASYDLTLRRPHLRPEQPMPASLDAFGIRFGVRPRT